MALDLDDIANRYNIADDGSREGDPAPVKGSLNDVLKAEDDAYNAWSLSNPKLASNLDSNTLFKTGPTSDTGQRADAILDTDKLIPNYSFEQTSPSNSSSTLPTVQNPDKYVYDEKSAYSRADFTKNLFGANLDVVSRLEQIKFESGADRSMINSIAYIRPWTRGGTSTNAQEIGQTQNTPTDDSIRTVIPSLWDDMSKFNSESPFLDFSLLSDDLDFGLDAVPKWKPEESLWSAEAPKFDYNFSFDDEKGSLYGSELYKNFFTEDGNTETKTSDAQEKQGNLKADTPTNNAGQNIGQILVEGGKLATDILLRNRPDQGTLAKEGIDRIANFFKVPSGPTFAGNPTGFLLGQARNALAAFTAATTKPANSTRAVYRGTTIPINLQSKSPKSGGGFANPGFGTPVVPPPETWQFLFNPSQISLSVGPNFKETETWGVGDEPNAGKPLHWTSYKNPQLKFSKVLLNGYVFGRKVEELEQGLIELFMKNPTNDAKHGPRVLEFVWGKKTFGPCVIKDVRVNQKMWDEGLLVNAEVDFTLERVPEWTINDGQVSTYDPSAQNTIIKPAQNQSTSTSTQSPAPNSSDKPQPVPPPNFNQQSDYQQCTQLGEAIRAGKGVVARLRERESVSFTQSVVSDAVAIYLNFLNKAGSSAANTGGTLRYNYKKCSPESMSLLRSKHNVDIPGGELRTNEQKNRHKSDLNAITQCAFDVQTSLEALYTGTKCNNFEEKPNNPTYKPNKK